MPPWSRILRALFVAYVAATAVHVGWIMAHEPFSFDAWNLADDTHAKPFSIGRFFEYWKFEYTHSNQRPLLRVLEVRVHALESAPGSGVYLSVVQARELRGGRHAADVPRAVARGVRARHRAVAELAARPR